MSRVGKKPVVIPSDVQVDIAGLEVKVKGKTSQLSVVVDEHVTVTKEGGVVVVSPRSNSRESRAAWGLVRNIIANMVKGVSEGFKITLEINGVGYRASVDGKVLVLFLGYSHPIMYAIPNDIEIKCPKPTVVEISGADIQKVGQIAAQIKKFRKPEPYKGKGIEEEGKPRRRKEGKKK